MHHLSAKIKQFLTQKKKNNSSDNTSFSPTGCSSKMAQLGYIYHFPLVLVEFSPEEEKRIFLAHVKNKCFVLEPFFFFNSRAQHAGHLKFNTRLCSFPRVFHSSFSFSLAPYSFLCSLTLYAGERSFAQGAKLCQTPFGRFGGSSLRVEIVTLCLGGEHGDLWKLLDCFQFEAIFLVELKENSFFLRKF